MNSKKMLSKEIANKVGGHIDDEAISEKVDQFFRYGNIFLLLELISLRREVTILKEELQSTREQKKKNTLQALIVP
jgi:K+-sensing histidine kinase KdpD